MSDTASILVFNTHLQSWYKWDDQLNASSIRAQIGELMEFIDSTLARYQGGEGACPAVIGGDFNIRSLVMRRLRRPPPLAPLRFQLSPPRPELRQRPWLAVRPCPPIGEARVFQHPPRTCHFRIHHRLFGLQLSLGLRKVLQEGVVCSMVALPK